MTTEKECPTCTGGEHKIFSKYCDTHNICVSCGVNRRQLTDVPWGCLDGAFQCKECEIRERQKRVEERKAKDFEHECTDEIICPYCGCEFGDSWERSDSGDCYCSDCEETFEYERIITCEYSTSKKETK